MPGEPRGESGSVTAVVALTLTIGALLALIVTDLGVVLLARRTAVAAADAAALAAAGAQQPHLGGHAVAVATGAAQAVARANGARLVECRCRSAPVTVVVAVDTDTRLLTHLGIDEVSAVASADLVRPP